ncbi:UNVERIFIED_CONTAM: Retrovirus-related Pol polyprotein from transposon TNT 1-94 [Sesamum indicum]
MFWADAVNTAAFLINRGPSVPLNNRIPEEVWSAYILNDDRTKLDAKSIKCTFIGYGTDEFGYRFWDDQNRENNSKVSPDDDKKEREFVDLDISNSGIMRPADTDSVGVQTDETEQTEIEPEPVSEELITESSTPLALGREPRLRRAPDRGSQMMSTRASGRLAMNDEMNSLKKNNTWGIVSAPKRKEGPTEQMGSIGLRKNQTGRSGTRQDS